MCKHFDYSNYDQGYSEWTPGSDFSIGCYKDKWNFDPSTDGPVQLRNCLLTARTCDDFEVSEHVVREIERVEQLNKRR